MSRLEDCDYRCLGCGLIVCRDIHPSPGEVDRICEDCYETEDPEDAA